MSSRQILQPVDTSVSTDWINIDDAPALEEPWYAVLVGRSPGVYNHSADIPPNLIHIPGALVVKCATEEQADREYEHAVHAGTAVRVHLNAVFRNLRISALPTLPMGETASDDIELSRRWYTVTVGRHPGVYNGPSSISANITGIPGATSKKFSSREEARQSFIAEMRIGNVVKVVYEVERTIVRVADMY